MKHIKSTIKKVLAKSEVEDILLALNSSSGMGFKYPIGNKELTEKVKKLESEKKIKYDDIYDKWVKASTQIKNIKSALEVKATRPITSINEALRDVNLLSSGTIATITGLRDGVTQGYFMNALEDWIRDNWQPEMETWIDIVTAFFDDMGIDFHNGKAKQEDVLRLWNEASVQSDITVIDYSKKLSDIKNLQDLPPETVKFLKTEIDRFESHGFQELIGYQGRQAVISMGGYWTANKFFITSYGTGNKDFGIPKQWSN